MFKKWIMGFIMCGSVFANECSYTVEELPQRFFIGMELKTTNEECSVTIPAHWNRFYSENVLAKIPHRVDGRILALYTDYEGDHTKPYSCIIGCEVSNLDGIPEGLVGRVIPESKCAVFTSQGGFPEGLVAVWQAIWKSDLKRTYSTDWEAYPSDFNPQENPRVNVYIAIERVSTK